MAGFLFFKYFFDISVTTERCPFCLAKRNQKRLLHYAALRVPCDALFDPKLRKLSAFKGASNNARFFTDKKCASRRLQVAISCQYWTEMRQLMSEGLTYELFIRSFYLILVRPLMS